MFEQYAQSNDLGAVVLDMVADPRLQRLALKWAVKMALTTAGVGFLHWVVVPVLFGPDTPEADGDGTAGIAGELSLID